MRLIGGLKYRDECRHMFVKLGIPALLSAYILQNLLQIKNNESQYDIHEQQHDYDTRNKSNLVPMHCRLPKYQRRVDYIAIHFYNRIPNKLKILPMDNFKRQMKNPANQGGLL
ncbi:hypothetical protein WA026_012967 [Henosepilachna vigintioctopunctata]|uniref:Uncharacterized protein n=1 Tax=Henosepilachna vigintioctopunctata TaxID=420089 RepID=A0AAW1TK73_9CUCU